MDQQTPLQTLNQPQQTPYQSPNETQPGPAPEAFNIPPPSAPNPHSTEPLPKKDINIYNVSKTSVFFRNFIAGAGRALGAVFIYFVFLSVVGYIVSKLIIPQLQPILSTFESIGNLSSPQANPAPYRPEQVNQILKQLQDQPNSQIDSSAN